MLETLSNLETSVVERFLRYVRYDTQSDDHAQSSPSTSKQLVLLDLLVAELRALGLADAARDPTGVVMATIPATAPKPNVPVIGFVAHVDTSPELSGAGVVPIVHRAWKGGEIALPDEPMAVLRASENPALVEHVGEDIITASGTTLLGADDKAGVAEIMAAAEWLVAHPEVPHGMVRIGFTPDEEVGRGTEHFDIAKFGAAYAYTLDGEGRGGLDVETFSADSMIITFQGVNTHPGYANGKMVNAIKIAADFLTRLPAGELAPEKTSGRDGFVHPNAVEGAVDRTSVRFIVRDFESRGLQEKEALLERLARETVGAWPGSSVGFERKETYRNMKEILDRHPQVVENGLLAIRRAGLEPRMTAVRGGTDGSRLSHMGLPCPNLFAGGHNFHSRLEWVTAQDMRRAVETIVHLCRIWEERA